MISLSDDPSGTVTVGVTMLRNSGTGNISSFAAASGADGYILVEAI